MRLEDFKWFVQDHLAQKWESWDLNLGPLEPNASVLFTPPDSFLAFGPVSG